LEEDKLNERQKEMKINGVPSFINLLGYITFPVCCLMGPFIEYRDYLDYLHEDKHYKVIPTNLAPALKSFVLAMISMVLNLLLPVYGFSPQFCGTDLFFELPFW
jgi:D-alanyl-lipoteichoic acid acyltransferase DltB (MBOAT superfamily)